MKIVHQINVKLCTPGERGLPKKPVNRVFISKAGLEGDFNSFRTHKKDGDPDMAVLLYPLETIQELNDEGWPIKPGDLGENLTITSFDHSQFQPNQQFKIGECVLEISLECDPCTNLKILPYVGEQNVNEFIKVTMNRRGWFARVLNEGWVKKGNQIEQLK
tara:strand:+ start:301 stop:783 length:483 start_codon:yes stop_codon:yes gene_type:complete